MFVDEGGFHDPVGEVVWQVSAALDALAGIDVELLSGDERSVLVAESARLGDRMDAARSRVIESWDAQRCWADDGARSGQAWLRNKTHRSSPWAGRELRRARVLRRMPQTAAAFNKGRIAGDHVRVLANARTPRTAAAFDRDEDLLVGYAVTLRFDHFERAVDYWHLHADPDGPADRARRQHDDRALHHSKTLWDTWRTDARWDKTTGTEIDKAIRTETDRLFKAEWAAAKHRLGTEPTLDDLDCTPTQRRADALANLIRRGHAAAPDAATVAPLLNIVIGLDTFTETICELFDGTVLTSGEVTRQLTRADIRRIVFDGPDRVLSVGPRNRFFRGALRDAITIRDRECRHDLCDIGADQCDIDHVVPYPDGPTTEANGEALCDHHNGAKGHNPDTRRPNTWYRHITRPKPEPPDH
jgi:hypothetical protein